ncbi:MAG: M48 family metallopeptidase [Candidatus Omnitrophica bacterium]|nr:M48 family metallopeptidase [Candidatus Omnitrophota bacterium]
MEVKIIRSQRRRRSVNARLINDLLVVNAPALLSQVHLDEIINGFKIKFAKIKIKNELDKKESLRDLAKELNKEYFNSELKIESIEYVTGQNSRFGCCNYRTGRIRISHKIGMMPRWVRKYVLIHEMAHLVEPNHSRSFWNIVLRYRLTERARGYLMAVGSIKAPLEC